MKQVSKIFLLIILTSLFIGCMEKRTDDPIQTYKLWAGEKPPMEVEVIHGKYWESPHWSKEYIIYLELKTSLEWKNEFIKQNHLVQNKTNQNIPSDAPSWFKPTESCRIWMPSGFTQGSTYYEDTLSGHIFIYEIQL